MPHLPKIALIAIWLLRCTGTGGWVMAGLHAAASRRLAIARGFAVASLEPARIVP
jgi:hypothetical protein